MSVNNNIYYYICLFTSLEFVFFVNGNTSKGSLTFVIDDTYSMHDDIDAVKQKTHALFNAVLKSNSTNIDDFILVTFNDPEVNLRVITRDPNEFRRALDNIQVHGGGDCPEYSMSGISFALEKSKPNSYFYVYTDASAKDYKNFERVKSLSIKKSTQVTFLLTGECSGYYSEDFAVYNNIATATNGQVFHIQKGEVGKIIDYIIESVKGVKTTIGQKYLNEYSSKKFQFNVDKKEWDIVVSVASNGNPKFNVIGPDGRNVKTKNIVVTSKNLIKKLTTSEPGTYTVHLENKGNTTVSVTASTSVTFKHGFSTLKPESLNETATKPISGTRSHIAILLENLKRDVTLKTVEIIDIEDNIILKLPLKITNKDKQFYVSDSFVPGNQRFKLKVVGYTKEKMKIIRLGPTTIEPQDVTLEKKIENKKPVTTILGDTKITTKYDNDLVVKCKVNAYPKPNVIWEDSSGTNLSSTMVPVDLPYDYISTLNLKSVKNKLRITCKAVNVMGEAETSVNIEIQTFLKVLASPIDTTVSHGHTKDFHLKVNAYPSINITWYKDSKPINSNEDYRFSQNYVKLIIKNMNFNHTGKYFVRVSNGYQEENITFNVFIHAASPVIVNNLADKNLTGVEGDLVLRIPCMATGNPKPTITWMIGQDNIDFGTKLYDTETNGTLIIKKLSKDKTGVYICKAENPIGSAFEEFHVDVQPYPRPDHISTEMLLEEGASTKVECDLPHKKEDLLRWYKEGKLIHPGDLYLSNVKTSDSGVYTCRVSNYVYSHSSHKRIIVGRKPKFISEEETNIEYNEGLFVLLNCDAIGDPEPTVRWFHNDLLINETIMYIYRELNIADIGTFTCNISNKFGTIFRTFKLFAKECILDIETDFNKGQPLITNKVGQWRILENKEGLIQIPKDNSILLICPENKIIYKNHTFNEYEIAKCSNEKTFEIKRKRKVFFVDFTELKCLKENRPLAKISKVPCGPANENTKLITVGFSVRKRFMGVYDVCIDKDKRVPIYAKHILNKSFSNKIPKTIRHIGYTSSTHLPFDFDYMYQCVSERSEESVEECCYTERQLISPRDVLPGLPQVATYNYLNIVPHWSTCGTENWDEIERRVRVLTQDLDKSLEVWTGSSSPLRSPAMLTYRDTYLTDQFNLRQPIAPFMWKVVINPEAREALAIIQLNIRDLTKPEAEKLLPCRDICHKVEWMRHTEWYDVNKGFTICCTIKNFKSAFGFTNQFNNIRDILKKHS